MSELLSYNILGKGKPVVLLHGFLENKNMWEFMSFSDQNDLQLIMIDLPGHGNSAVYNEVNTMEFMAEKVKEVLDEEHIYNYHIVGHSMGGYVALALAELDSKAINSLGLFFSSPFADSPEKKEQRLRAAQLANSNKEEFIRLGIRALFNPHRTKDLSKELAQATAMANTTKKEGIAPALKGMRVRKDRSEILERTLFPKFWIYGEYDTAVDKDQVESFLKDKDKIKEYRLPIGHMGHLESPEICDAIIREFLETL